MLTTMAGYPEFSLIWEIHWEYKFPVFLHIASSFDNIAAQVATHVTVGQKD